MYFTARFLAISAAISQVIATPTLTNSAYDLTEGQAFTITWSGASGPVTLLLKDGASTDLGTVATIGSGLTGTSFSWTPSDLPSDTYAIEISDSTGVNYSPQFTLQGTGTVSTVVATTATTASTAESTTKSVSSTASSTTTSASITTTSSSSAAPTSTGFTNSTTSASSTSTASKTKTTSGSSSSSTSTPINTNNSQKLGSSLAFVVMTAAALMIFS